MEKLQKFSKKSHSHTDPHKSFAAPQHAPQQSIVTPQHTQHLSHVPPQPVPHQSLVASQPVHRFDKNKYASDELESGPEKNRYGSDGNHHRSVPVTAPRQPMQKIAHPAHTPSDAYRMYQALARSRTSQGSTYLEGANTHTHASVGSQDAQSRLVPNKSVLQQVSTRALARIHSLFCACLYHTCSCTCAHA